MDRHREWNAERATEIVEAHGQQAGPLMPVLHALQREFGYIESEAVPIIARILNLSLAEVHGVISFYKDFRTSPRARHTIRLCRAEACQAKGARGLAGHVERKLGIGFAEQTGDALFALEPVYCLGNCACAPAMMVDGVPFGRLSADRFDQIVDDLRRRM